MQVDARISKFRSDYINLQTPSPRRETAQTQQARKTRQIQWLNVQRLE